tara:strand:- start:74 stop:700 length:627 start_codon:yes stop_codon:yes gene_type:complete
MKIEEVDIELIIPYKNNPREIPIEAVESVKKSILQFGNNQPIVVDKDNIIVVGHTRWRALKNLGRKKAFIIKKDFKPEDAKAYRIMDNRSGQNSKWEKALLKAELQYLTDKEFNLDFTGLGFDEIQDITEKKLEFNAPNNLVADINLDNIQPPSSSVKMQQLFFTKEQSEKFNMMIEELKVEYNKANLTDTVFTIIEKEYKEYKNEKN